MKSQGLEQNNRQSYLPGIIAILLWSTGAYFIYQMKHIPTCQILVVGQLAGGLISISLEKGKLSWSSLSRRLLKGWPALLLFWISQYGYVYAFQNAPPAQIDLIFYTWPAILIIVKSLQVAERLNGWDWAGIFLGFTGIFVLLYPDLRHETLSTQYILGYFGGVLGALGWVCYLLSTEPNIAERTGFSTIGEDIFILGVFNFFVISCSKQWVEPNEREWMMLAIYAVGMFGIPYHLWRITLGKAPKMASALSNATPILSIMWLVMAGITAFTFELVASLTMVKAGIYCIDRSQNPRQVPENIS